jgi:NADH-quinone oxidoreductase subunit L
MAITFFDLAWLIPFLPLLVFVLIALFAHRSRALSQQLAIYGIVISTGLALVMFLANMLVVIDGQPPEVFQPTFGRWFSLGTSTFLIGIYIDQLNALMLAVLGLACLVIFIYSVGAMQDDPRAGSFFALMSLLVACVLGLLIFDNLLLFLVFWVMMDACAYLLVGLGHEQRSAREAALKVFLVAGAGDLLLLFGVALLHFHVGSLTYANVLKDPATLKMLAETSFLDTQYSVMAVVALLFFGAAMVKSGQFPFHIWLPEAAEAPAPASALIHTATAFAGTFLLIRVFPLLEAAMGVLLVPELGLTVVALVGVFTAVFAAVVAATQRDMRRALSFFAIGQLGYAIAALGMGAYVAGVFQLVTNVLSNTLLFLAAGSVTYGMEHGRQDQLEGESFELADSWSPNDMFNMGGLGERQPATLLMFLVGGASLVGFPLFTAGFWSKDAILAWTYTNNPTVFWVLALIAAVTSFGVMRQLGLIFVGAPRSRTAARVIESTPAMAVPLILTLFVLVIGLIGIPVSGASFLDVFLGVGGEALQSAGGYVISESMALWSAVGVLGVAVGFLVYAYAWTPAQADEMDPVESLMRAMWLGWLYSLLRNAFYVGELTRWSAKLAVLLGRGLALGDDVLDKSVIGTIRWLGRAPSLALGWLDARALTPLFGPIDRAAEPVAQVAGWVDVRLGVPADQLRHIGKYPAFVAGLLDRWLDRLVNLTKPGTLALARLSVVVDRGLDIMVKSAGRAVRVSGLWFRPKTGKAQDYLRLAAVAVVVLVAMFLLFLFVQI